MDGKGSHLRYQAFGGIAVQHAELLEQLRRKTMLFLDLISHINFSLDIKQILGNLTKDICRALEMKCAAIRLLDKDTGDLKLVASYGLSEQFLNKGPVSSTKSSIQAIKGKTVLIKDATKDRRIQYKKAMKAEGIVSMIIAPVKPRNEVIGVMRLYSNNEGDFPEDEITLINALAHMGGLAIENASCYLTLQEDMKDLKEDLWSHRSWFYLYHCIKASSSVRILFICFACAFHEAGELFCLLFQHFCKVFYRIGLGNIFVPEQVP